MSCMDPIFTRMHPFHSVYCVQFNGAKKLRDFTCEFEVIQEDNSITQKE